MSYWGIVVDQSLKDKNFLQHLNVIANKQIGSWKLLLVSIPDHELEEHIQSLQHEMIDIKDGCWYAHFFKDNELIVIYQDSSFLVTIDPTSWMETVQYGLAKGFPMEQLDFSPRTKVDAATYFGLIDI